MNPVKTPPNGGTQALQPRQAGKAFWQTLFVQSGTLLLATAISYVSALKLSQTRAAQMAGLWAANAKSPVLAALDGVGVLEDTSGEPGETAETLAVGHLKLRIPLSDIYYRRTGQVLLGMASWFGPGFHGRRAADGSRFDMNAMTAAHKTLPFGTIVRVTNQRTGKSCMVRITDRGPYVHGRIIDLSRAAAKSIGMLGSGTAPVKLEVVEPRDTQMAERLHEINNEA